MQELDYSKPEYGPEYLKALVRESQAAAAGLRRERGLPEPAGDWPNTFMGLPVKFVDNLEELSGGRE